MRAYPCPADDAAGSLLADDLCHVLSGDVPLYLFIDDFHLLTDGRIAVFLCMLANRLPDNIHMIVASRDRFLPGEEALRLGRKLCRIGVEQLRLNHRAGRLCPPLRYSAHRPAGGGPPLFQRGVVLRRVPAAAGPGRKRYLPDHTSDIYSMFTAAMIAPLPPKQREFLAVMGLADEFTAEMARFITENEDTDSLLLALTEQKTPLSSACRTALPSGFTNDEGVRPAEFRAMAAGSRPPIWIAAAHGTMPMASISTLCPPTRNESGNQDALLRTGARCGHPPGSPGPGRRDGIFG